MKFKISPRKDIDGFYLLLNHSFNAKKIMYDMKKEYPNLIESLDIINDESHTRRYLQRFVIDQFKLRKLEIKTMTFKIEERWDECKSVFFNKCSDLFKNHDSFVSKYVAYPSIWRSYVRNFKTHSISFPINAEINESVFVIAHEVLHIFFYNYIGKKYPNLMKEEYVHKVWDFSEVLNVIIQEQKEFIDIFSVKPKCYSQHESLYKKMKEDWKKNRDIDCLIKLYLFDI